METRAIPVSKLEKLEQDRVALFQWLESLGKLSGMELLHICDFTETMWEVANRREF